MKTTLDQTTSPDHQPSSLDVSPNPEQAALWQAIVDTIAPVLKRLEQWGERAPSLADLRNVGMATGISLVASACLPELTIDPDGDGDGFEWSTEDESKRDCDDYDATVYPGAPEICDGKDNDCDGDIDEDATDAITYFTNDDDGDGYASDASREFESCEELDSPTVAGDCNDDDPLSYPGAPEQCDGDDNDCDGAVDEDVVEQDWYIDADGDGQGAADDDPVTDCAQPAENQVPNNEDCDDSDPSVYAGAPELCGDEIDQDCAGDGDGGTALWFKDSDLDGYGANDGETTTSDSCEDQPEDYAAVDGDCDDEDIAVNPSAEEIYYDGVDQNCDDASDYDADGDGYDTVDYGGDDCDDTDSLISPAEAEGDVCDNVDNDCNDAVDDLDNGDICHVLPFNISGGYTGGWEDYDGDGTSDFITPGLTSASPDYLCNLAGYGDAVLAVATFWPECNGPGEISEADLDAELNVSWPETSCTGEPLSDENSLGVLWNPNVSLTVTDDLSAYEDAAGNTWSSASYAAGWTGGALCQESTF
jgi:hypothetical protein